MFLVRFVDETSVLPPPPPMSALDGVVELTFTIDARGAVPVSTPSRSTLGHEAAERCMVAAVRRWGFPAPSDGALVMVKLPVTFSVLPPSPAR